MTTSKLSYQQRYYRQRRKVGQCARCHRKARKGKSLCGPCAEQRNAYTADRYRQMREALEAMREKA